LQDSEPTNVDVVADAIRPDLDEEALKSSGWMWHCFHESVMSMIVYPLSDRIDEIQRWKPAAEQARRLRLIRPADLTVELIEKLNETVGYKASVDALGEIDGLAELHYEQCVSKQGDLGCPWNDDQRTLFPELPRDIIGGDDWGDFEYEGELK
jgi:hypothetical protein